MSVYSLGYTYQDESGWYTETLDSIGDISGVSLELDTEGYPHIIYNNNGSLKYTYQDSLGWHIQDIEDTGDGFRLSLVLDNNDYPHFSYVVDSGYGYNNLMYAYQSILGWHIQTIDNENNANFSSLALDKDAFPHFSYRGDVGLMYAFCTPVYQLYLPLATRRYPPLPEIPTLSTIANPDGNGSYTVSWGSAYPAESYILEESINGDFSGATQVYNGSETSTTISGREPTRYYYRVKAHNSYGDSGWSNSQSVDVVWELEPNNDYLHANGPLLSGLAYYGFPNDQKDYFKVYLPADGALTIDLTNHTGSGVQLQLFYEVADAAHRVGFDYDAPYHITYSGAAGWYYVYVYTESGFNSATPYTLQVIYP